MLKFVAFLALAFAGCLNPEGASVTLNFECEPPSISWCRVPGGEICNYLGYSSLGCGTSPTLPPPPGESCTADAVWAQWVSGTVQRAQIVGDCSECGHAGCAQR